MAVTHNIGNGFVYDIARDDLIMKNLLCNIDPYNAGIDFSRQNLTSVDVRFCRLKSIPAL